MTNHGTLRITMLAVLGAVLLPVRGAEAGCGCAKPPPPPAAVRPNVTYEGAPVTLLGASLGPAGRAVMVTFTSGVTGQSATAEGVVERLRDLADGAWKDQVIVDLPALALGPASIRVADASTGADLSAVTDDSFTVAPTPIAVPADYGSWQYPEFRAAVGRDGVAYVALDVTGISKPMVIDARAIGYPLRFRADDVVFYNTQGILMQALVAGGKATPIPGMFVLPAASSSRDSDTLRYSRHEFSTYFLQHEERTPHAVDATDGSWHVDGTRHVDHDHLILAIDGTLAGGARPTPGSTPSFTLAVATRSLFFNGLTGISAISVASQSSVDAYDSSTGETGFDSEIFTLGTATLSDNAVVRGDAFGAKCSIASTARLTGQCRRAMAQTFMQVAIPANLPALPAIAMGYADTRTITGPGSFVVPSISLGGQSILTIDNSEGPVTLYVTGAVTVGGNAQLRVTHPDPERFAIYVAGNQQVKMGGSSNNYFYGVVYAPNSTLTINGNGHWFGAFLGKSANATSSVKIHYDRGLKGG